LKPTKIHARAALGSHISIGHYNSILRSFATAMEEAAAADAAADPEIVQSVLRACEAGDQGTVLAIVAKHGRLYGCHQDLSTGTAPLMVAAHHGQIDLIQYLLTECHAPWNAIDRNGRCAGNYATDAQHWMVVELLVDWAVRAELVLGAMERQMRMRREREEVDNDPRDCDAAMTTMTDHNDDIDNTTTMNGNTTKDDDSIPVAYQPSTKPDYLRQSLHYQKDVLLDADQDAVMMEWERPLMKAHAEILMMTQSAAGDDSIVVEVDSGIRSAGGPTAPPPSSPVRRNKRVLNVGFGLGIIDGILQDDYHPAHHIIIEAHPDVYRRMQETGWTNRGPHVRVCFGKWQDVIPQLQQEGVVVDAIFFDTYGEHYHDMQDFHVAMTSLLAKPHGIYSFFNGLAPDNLFFHGVACQCVKLHLASLGLDSEFAPCELQGNHNAFNDPSVWENVRRRYWHGRDTYYLPIIKWNEQFLATGQVVALADASPLLKRKNQDNDGDGTKMDQDDDHGKSTLEQGQERKRPAC
jgi:type IV protein arginine methyltransferase